MLSEILLETEGGTPLLAIHRYDPISLRDIFESFKTSPLYELTRKNRKLNNQIIICF